MFTFREWKYFKEHEKYQSFFLKTMVSSLLFKSRHELNMSHLSITAAPVFGIIQQTNSARGTENWIGKSDMSDDIKSDSLDKLHLMHRTFQHCLKNETYKHMGEALLFFCISKVTTPSVELFL